MAILPSRGIAFHSPTPEPATGNRLHSRPCYGTIGSSVPGVSILRFRCRVYTAQSGHFRRMPSSSRVGFCSKSDFGDGSACAVKYKIVPVNFLRAGDRPHGFCGMSMSLRVDCCSKIDYDNGNPGMVKDQSVSVVLLAGGSGKRMGASIPKQYLPLLGQPIALYSFYTFSKMSEVKEIIVVCDPSYKDVFEDAKQNIQVGLKFALPGKERQDSVYNGLQEIDLESELVCVHDSARPLVLQGDIEKVLKDGYRNGAAVLGVPVKATIKEADSGSFVVKTLDRKTLWEMQTPQVIKPQLLRSGFELVNREGLEVTDDVSIVEHLKHHVYITEGSYTNIKMTTPDDLLLAERILNMGGKVPGAEEILNTDAKVPAS